MNPEYPPNRSLTWEGCANVRDLGGLPILQGGETRQGCLVRADRPSQLTATGWQQALDYGARTFIDLRSHKEAQEDPYLMNIPPEWAYQVAYLNQPLEKYYPHVSALFAKITQRYEGYCINLDHYPDAIAEALRVILNTQPGVVVIHCSAGKDRTGLISALLLRLAGVPDALIAADYAQSQANLMHIYEKALADAGSPEKVDFWSRPTATADMMYAMLAHVDTQYGGVRPYLLQAGMSEAEMDALASRLTAA
jgi:protein-tyrosine phosphatase